MNHKQADRKERIELQKRFGLHLKMLRKSKGISPAELTRRTFMERSNIARLENGRINPSLFILKKISEALGIELEELLKGFK
jgi:transcriptional regulator with XRE-family HTH domain